VTGDGAEDERVIQAQEQLVAVRLAAIRRVVPIHQCWPAQVMPIVPESDWNAEPVTSRFRHFTVQVAVPTKLGPRAPTSNSATIWVSPDSNGVSGVQTLAMSSPWRKSRLQTITCEA